MPALKSEGCFNDWSLYRLHKYARTFHFFSPHIAKKASRETYPYNFMRERISREFSKLIWSLRSLLYPFLKPDQNSVCCLLLNYVSLKHKCVGFRKLQISAFPYDLGKCNFNQFYLGWKNIVCIILWHKGAVSLHGHPIFVAERASLHLKWLAIKLILFTLMLLITYKNACFIHFI